MRISAEEVLAAVAALPREDWVKIQVGIADLMIAKFAPREISEINAALAEAEAEFGRGAGMDSTEIKQRLGM